MRWSLALAVSRRALPVASSRRHRAKSAPLAEMRPANLCRVRVELTCRQIGAHMIRKSILSLLPFLRRPCVAQATFRDHAATTISSDTGCSPAHPFHGGPCTMCPPRGQSPVSRIPGNLAREEQGWRSRFTSPRFTSGGRRFTKASARFSTPSGASTPKRIAMRRARPARSRLCSRTGATRGSTTRCLTIAPAICRWTMNMDQETAGKFAPFARTILASDQVSGALRSRVWLTPVMPRRQFHHDPCRSVGVRVLCDEHHFRRDQSTETAMQIGSCCVMVDDQTRRLAFYTSARLQEAGRHSHGAAIALADGDVARWCGRCRACARPIDFRRAKSTRRRVSMRRSRNGGRHSGRLSPD